ncbi:intermembrane phospholipid transport protein YdbH family protein [Sphingomonas sp. Tas61C01]|uniref:intermembrane phospholipid transport protein YdbH family protein n=1 Tax=Sphingomonas sp. Tas61C01 TaxID=3458297 RepID=UPI00403EE421
MSVTEDGEALAIRPVGRRRRLVARLIALLLVAALVVLWIVRKPIAERYIDRALASSGVPASYGIADLGLGRQRLTNVVIGDPAHPDLVADWIETDTQVGFGGASLVGVRAGRLRVRGRLVDGRVSLGAIDRLLPASSGKPFALPALDLDVADGRMRLETPYGVVGVALVGRGRLDRGFRGRAAVVSARLGAGDCAADRVEAALRVTTARGGRIGLDGPLRVASIRCKGVATAAVRSDLDATLVTADRLGWTIASRLAVADLRAPGATARSVAGTIALRGDGRASSGPVALTARTIHAGRVQVGRAALDGDLALGGGAVGYTGRASFAEANATALLPAIAASAGAGTPLAPLIRRFADAARRTVGDVAGSAVIELSPARALVTSLVASSASGARLAESGKLVWQRGTGVAFDGTVTLAGGDLPAIDAHLVRTADGTLRGTATVAPYTAAESRLALTPVTIAIVPGGTTRLASTATLSGPLGDGQIDGLSLPLEVSVARDLVRINPACTPLGFDRLVVSGLTLDPARVKLCPTRGALVEFAGGRLGGGATLGAVRLRGRLGTTPLDVAATGADLRLADRGIAVRGVAARIGAPDRVTRLDFGIVSATVAGGAVAGKFTGGGGQIANVPLLLGTAAGDWTLERGVLALTGAMTVSDAAAVPRFQPLAAEAVSLRLKDGAIAAAGTLFEPSRRVKVADVAIDHRLATGVGRAAITVPGITFDKAFQPELLTRLTFGVIADVRGAVTGRGDLAWSPAGVTSTGIFSTDGTDLAAAFGPVTGIAGTIRFTDLLALQSAPGQVATIGTINPGIPVTDGRVTYQTLPNSRVAVAGARWPFAGGVLTLDPTLLDFSAARSRRMTFRIDGAAADKFLQQFDFKNLDATGVFDGVVPMVFDDAGGRIENGRLTVRAGGGGLAYVGDLTQKDLGLWGNLAFQALKSLRYRDLAIVMNGALAGEMITEVRFAGISQGAGAKSNFLVRRLQRLPFVFNIRIRAPFRGLLDSAASFYDPSRLIQRNLPQLLERQNRRPGVAPSTGQPPTGQSPTSQPPAIQVPAIQPSESEKMP